MLLLASSCQKMDYKSINFADNDAVIYSTEKYGDYLSEVEIIIELDNRVKGASKVDDFNTLCMGFGAYKANNEFSTKGQQCFTPQENVLISNQDKIELLDVKYDDSKYLYLKINLLTLRLTRIDEFFIYFHLRDMQRQPNLRYNTEPFFYRSERAKRCSEIINLRPSVIRWIKSCTSLVVNDIKYGRLIERTGEPIKA